MYRMSVALARFALSAWVGAAALFVVTGIREVRSPLLDSYVRDVLVGIRFPAYYVFGFALVGVSACAAFIAAITAPGKLARQFAVACLTAIALLAMVADYFAIYLPLLEMIMPPGESRPAEFIDYHTASKWVNLFSVSLCAIAGFILCGQRTENAPSARRKIQHQEY